MDYTTYQQTNDIETYYSPYNSYPDGIWAAYQFNSPTDGNYNVGAKTFADGMNLVVMQRTIGG